VFLNCLHSVQIIGSIPTNVNGLALGMIGLGMLWQTAAGGSLKWPILILPAVEFDLQ